MDFKRRTSTFEHYDLEQHIVGAAVMENGVEITLEKPMPTFSPSPKMRVLCLHGMQTRCFMSKTWVTDAVQVLDKAPTSSA